MTETKNNNGIKGNKFNIKEIEELPKNKLIVTVVKNLTRNVTEAHLKEIFSQYGEIEGAYIPIDKLTSLKKTYGFIEFTNMENAKKAELYMDGGQIDGKIIEIEIIDPKNYID